MTRSNTVVDICGVGIWSEHCGSWDDFITLLNGGAVSEGGTLKPELIAPRERRRAPQSVKLAVEIMHQACAMAGVDPAEAASVFASGMGDMQLTDYMCTTLLEMPRAVSPTRFHNSVHNAATGYWSIATGSHAAANAISGFDNSAAIALLEGAIQAIEEQTPVIVASEETAAPLPFTSIYSSTVPLGTALLLAPPGTRQNALATLRMELQDGKVTVEAPRLPDELTFPGNYAAAILPLLQSLATNEACTLYMPLTAASYLAISSTPGLRHEHRQ